MKLVLSAIVMLVVCSATAFAQDAKLTAQPPKNTDGLPAKAWTEADLRTMMKDEIAKAMPDIKQAVKDAVKEALTAQTPTPAATVPYSATGACDTPGVTYYYSATSTGACGFAGMSVAPRRGLFGGRLFGRRRAGAGGC